MNNVDLEYNRLIELVLDKGRVKKNRTVIDTLGVFGAQARFDLSEGFPLLTTKKVFTKAIIHELLWFLSGSTNIKYLVDNDVHIWDDNAYANYSKKIIELKNTEHLRPTEMGYVALGKDDYVRRIKDSSEFAKAYGDLGEGTYGGMWRAFPYAGDLVAWAEHTNHHEIRHVDQIQKVLDKLKTNPDDRRLIVSAWHPYWVDHCALPPCHCLFQFHTEELTMSERKQLCGNNWEKIQPFLSDCPMYGNQEHEDAVVTDACNQAGIPNRRLNCQLYQRSCDLFLGVPFNIASYALLMSMVAQAVNMVPGEFIHTYGDLHLYENSVDAAKLQISREPYPLPTLKLNPAVKDIFKFKYEDIAIEGYQSHPSIKVEMAV